MGFASVDAAAQAPPIAACPRAHLGPGDPVSLDYVAGLGLAQSSARRMGRMCCGSFAYVRGISAPIEIELRLYCDDDDQGLRRLASAAPRHLACPAWRSGGQSGAVVAVAAISSADAPELGRFIGEHAAFEQWRLWLKPDISRQGSTPARVQTRPRAARAGLVAPATRARRAPSARTHMLDAALAKTSRLHAVDRPRKRAFPLRA